MATFQEAIYELLKGYRTVGVDDNQIEVIPREAFNKNINLPIDLRSIVTRELADKTERELSYKYEEADSDIDNLLFLNLLYDEKEVKSIPVNQNPSRLEDLIEKYKRPIPVPPNKK